MDRDEEAGRLAARLEALCIITMILPTIAVALRFWSRLLKTDNTRGVCLKVGLWWDDWTALACLPFIFAHNSLMIRWAIIGVPFKGSGFEDLPKQVQIEGYKLFYISNFIWNAVNSLSRLAAVLLYIRVFTLNNRWFKWAVKFAIALVVARALIGIVGLGLLCIPAHRAWSLSRDGRCGSNGSLALVLAGQGAYVLIDAIIFALPLPIIWKLKLPMKKKAWMGVAMVYGYCVPVISIGTLVANIHETVDDDMKWSSITLLIWMLLEAPLAVTSICLPPMFFLFKRRFQPLARTTSPDGAFGDNDQPESLRGLRSLDSDLSPTFGNDMIKTREDLSRPEISAPVERPAEKAFTDEAAPAHSESPTGTRNKRISPVTISKTASLPTANHSMPKANVHLPSPLQSHPSSPNSQGTNFSRPRSTLHFHQDSHSGARPRHAKHLGLFSDHHDKPLPPIALSSDMLHARDTQPEYQAMIYTPPLIPGVRNRAEGEEVAEGMIRVHKEVNVEVRDERCAAERPLKDMLDTGLGLRREYEHRPSEESRRFSGGKEKKRGSK